MLNTLKSYPQLNESWYCLGQASPFPGDTILLLFYRQDEVRGTALVQHDGTGLAHGVLQMVERPFQGSPARPVRVVVQDPKVGDKLRPYLESAGIRVVHRDFGVDPRMQEVRDGFIVRENVDFYLPQGSAPDLRFRLLNAFLALMSRRHWPRMGFVVDGLRRPATGIFIIGEDTAPGFVVCPLDENLQMQSGWQGCLSCLMIPALAYGAMGRWPTLGKPTRDLNADDVELICAAAEIVVKGVDVMEPRVPQILELRDWVPEPKTVTALTIQPTPDLEEPNRGERRRKRPWRLKARI